LSKEPFALYIEPQMNLFFTHLNMALQNFYLSSHFVFNKWKSQVCWSVCYGQLYFLKLGIS